MIYNKNGTVFENDGAKYTIGGRVKATSESEYAGLYGRILEIRTDADKDTENETPDIYCEFDPPVLPSEVKKLESMFSALYGYPKTLEDIALDLVIMAPSMVMPLNEPGKNQPTATLFMLVSHWAVNGDGNMCTEIFTSMEDALLKLHDDLLEEKASGCIADWQDKDSFVEEDTEKSYEGYLDGEYCDNHFAIDIQTKEIPLSPRFIQSVLQVVVDNYKEANL